jgi:hypothetical protein
LTWRLETIADASHIGASEAASGGELCAHFAWL